MPNRVVVRPLRRLIEPGHATLNDTPPMILREPWG
jgi:hypothetical protein